MKEMLASAQAQANIEVNNNDVLLSSELLLFYAALIIRSSIKKVEGLKHQPLNAADINMDNAETLIPDDLYTFIYWIISNKPAESTETIVKSQIIAQNTSLHRQILSLGQDLVPGRGDSLTFMTGVIISGHFLRSPNMLTKFFKDPKYVEQIFRNPQKLC